MYYVCQEYQKELFDPLPVQQVKGYVHMASQDIEDLRKACPEENYYYNHDGIVVMEEEFFVVEIRDMHQLNEFLKDTDQRLSFERSYNDYEGVTLCRVWVEDETW